MSDDVGDVIAFQDNARRFICDLVQRDFGGDRARAAAALGVEQRALEYFLRKRVCLSFELLVRVADHAKAALDDVVGRAR